MNGMKRTAVLVATALCLASCGKKDEKPVPTPEPTYSSAREADQAVPPELRAEFQHSLECEMQAMAKAGKEPEVSIELIVRITKDVKAGRYAKPSC